MIFPSLKRLGEKMINLHFKVLDCSFLRQQFRRAVTYDGLHSSMSSQVSAFVKKLSPIKVKGEPKAVEEAARIFQEGKFDAFTLSKFAEELNRVGIEMHCGGKGEKEIVEIYFVSSSKVNDLPLFSGQKKRSKEPVFAEETPPLRSQTLRIKVLRELYRTLREIGKGQEDFELELKNLNEILRSYQELFRVSKNKGNSKIPFNKGHFFPFREEEFYLREIGGLLLELREKIKKDQTQKEIVQQINGFLRIIKKMVGGRELREDIFSRLSYLRVFLVKKWMKEDLEVPKDVSQGVEELLKIKNSRIVEIVARILGKRGIRSQLALVRFLSPSLEPAEVLPDSELAARQVVELIQRKRKITIYGDYDVDGLVGTSILFKALGELGARVDYFIPNRFREGFGLNLEVLKRLKEKGTEAVITVDCGTSAFQEIKTLLSWKIQPIVTDHHTPPSQLEGFRREEKFYLVNPKLLPENHPSWNLCGAATAYKLASLVYQNLGKDMASLEHNCFGMLALATIADVVPLLGENRAIVKRGLAVLREKSPLPIWALRKAGDLGEISTTTMAFGFAPMINALGRLEDAHLVVELFSADDSSLAIKIAKRLQAANERRKLIERSILEDALAKIILEYPDFEKANSLVLWDEKWHEGVVGIDASRLVEAFGRPVLLFSFGPTKAKGSGRSLPGLSLYRALQGCAQHLAKWGGHEVAAGFSIEASNLKELETKLLLFRHDFSKSVEKLLEGKRLVPKIAIDAEINLSEVDSPLFRALRQLEPFGAGNPLPNFLVKEIYASSLGFSAEGEHLYARLSDGKVEKEAVAWRKRYLAQTLSDEKKVNVVFSLALDSWRGDFAQIEILDVKENEV